MMEDAPLQSDCTNQAWTEFRLIFSSEIHHDTDKLISNLVIDLLTWKKKSLPIKSVDWDRFLRLLSCRPPPLEPYRFR